MTEKARIFVGCDDRSGIAERALQNSICRHSSIDVEFIWMRHTLPELDWTAVPEFPWEPGGWATQYSNFRYAVPELCKFAGRAIFLDSDMVVLGDIRELWSGQQTKPWRTISIERTHVSVIDCEYFETAQWWPRLTAMKGSRQPGRYYSDLLSTHDLFEFTIDDAWDCRDTCDLLFTKLIHFTDMKSQPWKPWPERFHYVEHPDETATKQFWAFARE